MRITAAGRGGPPGGCRRGRHAARPGRQVSGRDNLDEPFFPLAYGWIITLVTLSVPERHLPHHQQWELGLAMGASPSPIFWSMRLAARWAGPQGARYLRAETRFKVMLAAGVAEILAVALLIHPPPEHRRCIDATTQTVVSSTKCHPPGTGGQGATEPTRPLRVTGGTTAGRACGSGTRSTAARSTPRRVTVAAGMTEEAAAGATAAGATEGAEGAGRMNRGSGYGTFGAAYDISAGYRKPRGHRIAGSEV
jgi:hypothetical protein